MSRQYSSDGLMSARLFPFVGVLRRGRKQMAGGKGKSVWAYDLENLAPATLSLPRLA